MIITLLDKVDNISQQFVFNGYQQLANTYSPAIYGLATLCVIIYGYAVFTGWASLSLAEISKRVLTIGLILSFALNWGIFSSYIYTLFTKVPNEISNNLIKIIPNSHYSNVGGVNSALQQSWYDGVSFCSALWERGDWRNWFPFFWAVVIFILVLLLIGIALVELVVAKFGLAIFLVISPLIIPMLFFKATKEMIFDGWLKHIITFAFIPIFVTSALALCLTLLSDSVGEIKQAIQADQLTITAVAPYTIFLFICIGLVVKSTQMAASIANGFSIGMFPTATRAAGAIRREIDRYKKPQMPQIHSSPASSLNSAPSNPSHLSNKA